MEVIIIMTVPGIMRLNLHAVFSKGTLEWRCFESTLHAGKVRANITLALSDFRTGDQSEIHPDEKDTDLRKPGVYIPNVFVAARINRRRI